MDASTPLLFARIQHDFLKAEVDGQRAILREKRDARSHVALAQAEARLEQFDTAPALTIVEGKAEDAHSYQFRDEADTRPSARRGTYYGLYGEVEAKNRDEAHPSHHRVPDCRLPGVRVIY